LNLLTYTGKHCTFVTIVVAAYVMYHYRRTQREYTKDVRICDCHFINGEKAKGPTIFGATKYWYVDYILSR